MSEQDQRLKDANKLIDLLASSGRKLLSHADKISQFEIHDEKLFLRDKWTRKLVDISKSNQSGFSDGGTLWRLVQSLNSWIITGETSLENNFVGKHWGYKQEDLEKLWDKAVEIGFAPDLAMNLVVSNLYREPANRPINAIFRIGGIPNHRTVVMQWNDSNREHISTVTEDRSGREGLRLLREQMRHFQKLPEVNIGSSSQISSEGEEIISESNLESSLTI